MEKKLETEVIIVGAGPSGLALASQLIRYGVDFVILDAKSDITDLSKAIVVQARTLEIYEQIGLAERAIEQGAIARRVNIVADGEISGSVHLEDIGRDLSPYPFALLLEQSKNEELLYGHVRSCGKDVWWRAELVNVAQTSETVTATIRDENGGVRTITGKYLVGCDGSKSIVRRQLNFEFVGTTIDALFYVADVEMEFPSGKHDEIYVSFGSDSFIALFPLQERNFWRIVGNMPDEEGGRLEPNQVDYEETEAKIHALLKMPLDIKGVKWFSTYRVHSRRVDKFRDGRCFLAGDAAHIHTPAGGQGMNTGIGDAYNLAWKLAFVLRGRAEDSLLDTYDSERLENAKNLLETTDRAFTVGTQDDFFIGFLRTNVFPLVAGFALKFDWVKRAVFPLVSQIGINYRHSTLSDHRGDATFKIKAGDRMPYFQIDGRSVFDLLRQPKFHYLVFSNEAVRLDELLGKDLAAEELLDCQALPLTPKVTEIFGTEEQFGVLLRPDNHVTAISEQVSLETLKDAGLF